MKRIISVAIASIKKITNELFPNICIVFEKKTTKIYATDKCALLVIKQELQGSTPETDEQKVKEAVKKAVISADSFAKILESLSKLKKKKAGEGPPQPTIVVSEKEVVIKYTGHEINVENHIQCKGNEEFPETERLEEIISEVEKKISSTVRVDVEKLTKLINTVCKISGRIQGKKQRCINIQICEDKKNPIIFTIHQEGQEGIEIKAALMPIRS